MTDAELRDQERRCRDGYAGLEEQVEHLTDRVRAGTLSRERLDLAAYCGHAAALLAGGATAPPFDDALLGPLHDEAGREVEPRFARRLRWWAVGLRRWGPSVWARAVSTALALSAETDPRLADHRAELEDVSAAIHGWGECACDAHLAAARGRADALGRSGPASYVAQGAVGALAAPLEPARFGPFDAVERLRATGRQVSLAGGLVTVDEASLTLFVHDAGPRGLAAMGVLDATLRPEDRGFLRTPSSGQPFLDAEAAAGEEVVRRRLEQRLIAHALSPDGVG